MGATPDAHRPTQPPTDEERRVLSLLASGVTDETAALRLGWNSRTLRRRLQSAMTKLGALSRFQAGCLATLAGWLDGPAEPAETPEAVAGSGHGFVHTHKGTGLGEAEPDGAAPRRIDG